MRRMLLLSCAMAVLGVGVAEGKECKGINFPEQAQVEGSNLTLKGLGLRQATMFKVNVYVAALYVAKPSSDPIAILGSGAPSELILQFVRNVGADDLRKAWDEGFAKNAKERLPALRGRITTLNGWMVDVKADQRTTTPSSASLTCSTASMRTRVWNSTSTRAVSTPAGGRTMPSPSTRGDYLELMSMRDRQEYLAAAPGGDLVKPEA